MWASGALVVVFAPVLVPLAVWIYTLVFAFSALWFAHFALAALQALRAERDVKPVVPAARGAAPDTLLIEDVVPRTPPPALPPLTPP